MSIPFWYVTISFSVVLVCVGQKFCITYGLEFKEFVGSWPVLTIIIDVGKIDFQEHEDYDILFMGARKMSDTVLLTVEGRE